MNTILINKTIIKSKLFWLLNLLPGNFGDYVYHKLQNLTGHNLEGKLNSSYNTYLKLRDIIKKNGIDIKEKTIVEIGSGWLPIMPYFIKYLGGATKVETYDLKRHYQRKNILALNSLFEERFKKKLIPIDTEYPLPDSIVYHPDSNISRADIKGTDIVFSRFVLEHVTPFALEEMHNHFKKHLSPNSYIIHMISPGDHRAYDNSRLSLQDFLRYSEEEWNKIQTKFDYHNRWRLSQYLELFKKLNYDIVHLEYECPNKQSETYRKFKEVPLHKDYQKFSEEDLTAGSINIVLKVSN